MTANIDMRLGIDLGGTKTEVIVLADGQEILRRRVPTPSASYDAIVATIASLVRECRDAYGQQIPVGIGMPGALTDDGRVKNSNTVCVNGQPFRRDIENLLGGPVRIMNDANCFALSEAVDGAGADADVVFGVILGTGVGGGVVIGRQILNGCNSIGGEWGHNPLSPRSPRARTTARRCYCGKDDCIETFLCGKGLAQTWREMTGREHSAPEIGDLLRAGESEAEAVYSIYQHQLAACLATVINVLDPHVIVLGGGVSGLPGLAGKVQALLPLYVFSDVVKTRVLANCHGDSSGVRGAAWLWPA